MLKALGSGLVGACALTLIHESGRRDNLDAPRIVVGGVRAHAHTVRAG